MPNFLASPEGISFLQSQCRNRITYGVQAELGFNIIICNQHPDLSPLLFSEVAAVVAWVQANTAKILALMSPNAIPPWQLPWTGSKIDFNDVLGESGNLSPYIGAGAFGSGWFGTAGSPFTGQAVLTDAYWESIGSPSNKPHGTSAITSGTATVCLMTMTSLNTPWSYSAGSWYFLPGVASQNVFGPEYKHIVPVTNLAANEWVVLPMPDFDVSIFNNIAIPPGSNPSQYLVPGLQGLPLSPQFPGLDLAG